MTDTRRISHDTLAYVSKRIAKLKNRIALATADPTYMINGKCGSERIKLDQQTLARWEQKLRDIQAGKQQPIRQVDWYVVINKNDLTCSCMAHSLADGAALIGLDWNEAAAIIETNGRCDTDTHILIPLEPAP